MPWGDNNKGQGPWGGNNNQGGSHNSPPPPPDIDKILQQGKDQFQQMFGGGKKSFLLIGLIAVLVWLSSGIYVIDEKEQGVVLRFGHFHRTSVPGLNYHLPRPIERLIIVPTVVNQIEVGFRTTGSRGGSASSTTRAVPEESLMLTGDEKIVETQFEVQWRVDSPQDYLFNVRDPEDTVKSIAESAMREVIGRTYLADAIAQGEGKLKIQDETFELIQAILDEYQAGIAIQQIQLRKVDPPQRVMDAFIDVINAGKDQQRFRNEAEAYRNDILPKARGDADRIILEAEAYREQTIAKAEGQAHRFLAIYNKYKDAKEVTRMRMYLETMEGVLEGVDKILLDNKSGGVLPYLPLNEIKKPAQQ